MFLEDGTCLTVTEQELLDFGLRPGDQMDEQTLKRLKKAAGASSVKADAAGLIGRRAMSRADLEKKLRDKGASANDAVYAAEWLEAIGALNDADYAALMVRHCAQMGYGPARYQEELRRHGIDRELWEDAMAQAPDSGALIDAFLKGKLHGRPPEEKEKKRLTGALLRRGFSWGDVKAAWSRLGAAVDAEDD